MEEFFSNWKDHYNKTYASKEEEQERFNIFTKNYNTLLDMI